MAWEVKLGDVVEFGWNDGYDTGTISQVHADGTVDVFRPYTATADFSCMGSKLDSTAVMCYVGIEEVKGIRPDRLKFLRKGKDLR